jgi:hypothetical protein
MENDKLNKISDDLKQRQIAAIKEIVKLTFEHIDGLEKVKAGIQDHIKILKHDLFDLKDGRLDRILERQGMNEEIKGLSIIKVSCKQGEQGKSPWYVEYEVAYSIANDADIVKVSVNNSVSKMHASGSYKLKDGSIKYL